MAEMPLWVWIFFAIGGLGFLFRHPALLLAIPVLALSVGLTFWLGPLPALLFMWMPIASTLAVGAMVQR